MDLSHVLSKIETTPGRVGDHISFRRCVWDIRITDRAVEQADGSPAYPAAVDPAEPTPDLPLAGGARITFL